MDTNPEPQPLSESLDWLMRHTLDATRPFTAESLAYRVQARGQALSAQHVSSLRQGRRGAPSYRLLADIAEVLGVSVEYFTDAGIQRAVQADGVMTAEQRREATEAVRTILRMSMAERALRRC